MGLRSSGNAGRTSAFFRASAMPANIPFFASTTIERAHTVDWFDAVSGSTFVSKMARFRVSSGPYPRSVIVNGQLVRNA